jgi:branched-chain amino acid transport system permease protein
VADAAAFVVIGVVTGAVYAVAASGLVLTYTTANVFNMAHGATGMVMAFAYWELVARRGLPALLALALVVGLLAPATGMLMNRVLLRGVGEASVGTSVAMTLAVLLLLLGGAQALWPPTTTRLLPGLLPDVRVQVGGVVVTGHELATLAAAALVAVGLYGLLRHTRLGIAMRGRVDDPALLALSGIRPEVVADAAWAVSTALAALAGVLLAPVLQLDHLLLTLLVVNAYAAAVVGRL